MDRRTFIALLGAGAAQIAVPHSMTALQMASGPVTTFSPLHFKKYQGHSTARFMRSAKLRKYIEAEFHGTRAPFHGNFPLWSALWSWTAFPGRVTLEHNRFLVATGHMNHVAENRAMLWMEATKPATNFVPLTVIAFRSVRGPDSLSIFTSQPIFDAAAAEIPRNLTLSMNRWLRSRTKKQDGGPIRKVSFYAPSSNTEAPALSRMGIQPYRTSLNVTAKAAPLP